MIIVVIFPPPVNLHPEEQEEKKRRRSKEGGGVAGRTHCETFFFGRRLTSLVVFIRGCFFAAVVVTR